MSRRRGDNISSFVSSAIIIFCHCADLCATTFDLLFIVLVGLPTLRVLDSCSCPCRFLCIFWSLFPLRWFCSLCCARCQRQLKTRSCSSTVHLSQSTRSAIVRLSTATQQPHVIALTATVMITTKQALRINTQSF
jgi:hypothetical protein